MIDITNDLDEGTGETDPGWGRIPSAYDNAYDHEDYLDCANQLGLLRIRDPHARLVPEIVLQAEKEGKIIRVPLRWDGP